MTQTSFIADDNGSQLASLGTMRIRVVVVPKKPIDEEEADQQALDADDDEEAIQSAKGPLDTYMERKRYGKGSIVFLVNGQRHHSLDSTFIARDLGFKYLKNRMMIMVELDGLDQEAITEIVQGDRQGLFQGNIYNTIEERIVALLKNDKDLKRLQAEAEEEVAELESGDEAVKEALDQLIEDHHGAATHINLGEAEAGQQSAQAALSFGKDKNQEVVVETVAPGEPSSQPVLVIQPAANAIRLQPGVERTIKLVAKPADSWKKRQALTYRIEPAMDEMTLVPSDDDDGTKVTLLFAEPEDFDDEEYPLEFSFYAFAQFTGHEEVRMASQKVVVTKPRKPPTPKPAPTLRAIPTFLRILSRQPVKLTPGRGSTHVRLRWDGFDSLAVGSPAAWSFGARCDSLLNFPKMTFTQPRDGRFDLVIDPPHGVLPDQQLHFVVDAVGPNGQALSAAFTGVIVPPPQQPEPRKIKDNAPEATSQRRPPYRLAYVKEDKWDSATCWGETTWTANDAGAFVEPSDNSPLTLLVNEDFAPLKAWRDRMTGKYEEATVKRRLTNYSSHVFFHLYQMYRAYHARDEASQKQEDIHVPTDDDLREEIRRVAITMVRLMEVASH